MNTYGEMDAAGRDLTLRLAVWADDGGPCPECSEDTFYGFYGKSCSYCTWMEDERDEF